LNSTKRPTPNQATLQISATAHHRAPSVLTNPEEISRLADFSDGYLQRFAEQFPPDKFPSLYFDPKTAETIKACQEVYKTARVRAEVPTELTGINRRARFRRLMGGL